VPIRLSAGGLGYRRLTGGSGYLRAAAGRDRRSAANLPQSAGSEGKKKKKKNFSLGFIPSGFQPRSGPLAAPPTSASGSLLSRFPSSTPIN